MLDKVYNPKAVEEQVYAEWESKGLFAPEVADKNAQPYSVVMPPPNVTGVLHMGHALDCTIQDILVRHRRMMGDKALWMPGADHAGIATQSIVERHLKAEGKTRYDLGREAFLDRTWDWARQCEGNIHNQFRRLGISPDWERKRFTLDEGCSQAVKKAFVSLYEQGLLYRGEYIVNWDPETQSAISDIETDYTEEESFLWHIAYSVVDSDETLVVATTRPETMYADVAIAVHPDDERYQHLIGQQVALPLTGRTIPVLGDTYVERDFGTGVLKITPAHDPNDFEVGKRHGLTPLLCLDEAGKVMMHDFIPESVRGLDRFEARPVTEALLKESGSLVKKEAHTHRVGRAQRSGAVVEPLLSKQWFVKTKPLAEQCLKALEEGEIRFIPERWTKDYLRWMTNIQDWCISRQLWWGHQIPAWYCQSCGEITVSEGEPSVCSHCQSADLKQDPDVLDTWFSSGLWPFSTMGWPDESAADYQAFYPNNVLVTGFDIIFFWVARMTMMGHAFTGKTPFNTVYIHGLIRDEHGQKMSKSKGNTVDPVEAIDQYGCDGFRFALTNLITYGGQDIKLAPGVMDQGRLFTNKLWNAARFVLMNLEATDEYAGVDDQPICMDALSTMDRWILSRYNDTVQQANALLNEYKFGEYASLLYEFTWNNFCDWYVEYAKKPLRSEDTRMNTQRILRTVLDGTLKLMHPMMPYITEAIWQQLPHISGQSISVSQYPQADAAQIDGALNEQMVYLLEVVRALRHIRQQYKVDYKTPVDVYFEVSSGAESEWLQAGGLELVQQFVPLNEMNVSAQFEHLPQQTSINLVGKTRIIVPLAGLIDVEKEVKSLQKKLETLEKEQQKLTGMLGNDAFVAQAPPAVVQKNQARLDDVNQQVSVLKEQLAVYVPVG